ncbi:MAG TPA: hypothetical protein PLR27_08525 [Methanoregulaceae archaeon]|nr:MAG: hypothetical protein IPI71_00305 [Methanolinea sp.]HON82289.1 hypothetical protein [Methanoregulaceae archaeon]
MHDGNAGDIFKLNREANTVSFYSSPGFPVSATVQVSSAVGLVQTFQTNAPMQSRIRPASNTALNAFSEKLVETSNPVVSANRPKMSAMTENRMKRIKMPAMTEAVILRGEW